MAIATYADFLAGGQFVNWFPVVEYWPIGSGSTPAQLFKAGDGGMIDDTGLLPMLQRGAKRVVLFLFVGPGQQVDVSVNWCQLSEDIRLGRFDTRTFTAQGRICDSLYTLFGYGYDSGNWHKAHNAVFKRSDLFEVACELKKLKDKGRPLVYERSHVVQPNAYWGIREYNVKVLYAYNDRVTEFEAELPSDTQQFLQTDLKGFPTDLPAGLWLKPRVVHLMSALSEYTVRQNEHVFRRFFSR